MQTSLPKWNHWALIFGLLSTFGLSVVANFQETSVLVVHFIGALLCFGGGTAYFWTQVCKTNVTLIKKKKKQERKVYAIVKRIYIFKTYVLT